MPNQQHEGASRVSRPTFGQRQIRSIFREMIKAEIQGGVLRGSKRRQLLRFARSLGIPRCEACLIMAEVQHGGDGLDSREIHARMARAQRAHAMLTRLMLACALALIADVLLVNWLF